MKKIRVDDCICKTKLFDHKVVRDRILKCIESDTGETGTVLNKYHTDVVSKIDWSFAKDSERPWVKLFLPCFTVSLTEMMSSMGYTGFGIPEIWYQQYLEGNSHGWHVHGEHFTGVYYLEYPKGSSPTEICSPFNLRSRKIDVSEGDCIIFPSHWIHRGPPNKSERKTIISYNINIDPEFLDVEMIK